jgi:hypothetical protein
MTISTMDGLVAALATSQKLPFYIPSITSAGSSFYAMNFAANCSFGTLSLPAAASAGGTSYTSQPGAGALSWTAASGGNISYISRVAIAASQAGTLLGYDLLWACQGFSSGTSGAQNVTGFASLPSRASSAAELYFIAYAAWPATSPTLTVTYTNQFGVSGRTAAIPISPSSPAYRVLPIALMAGDSVQSIQSVSLSTTSGAVNFGLLLVNRLFTAPDPSANIGITQDFTGTGLPAVSDSAVVMMVLMASTTTSGYIFGSLDIAQG